MIAPANWPRPFLRTPAAAYLRRYLDEVLHDLEGAQIQRALTRLEEWVWPGDIDHHALPKTIVEITGRLIVEAYRYLMEADPDVTSAKDALQDARALWEVG